MAWSSGLQLRVTAGNDEGRVVLLNSPEITLGRAVETSESSPGWVLFSEPTVSRIHALLQWDDENQCYVLQHRSRTNPTLVRGVPVDGYPLHLHEKVSLGLLEFELEQAEARPGKLGNAVQRPGGAPASNAGGVFDALSDYAQNSRDTQKSREHMAGMAGLIDAALNSSDEEEKFSMTIVQGPDKGAVFPLREPVLVIGRIQGVADPRASAGVLLHDTSVPPEQALLVWQDRAAAYGILQSDSSSQATRIHRMSNGMPREIIVRSDIPTVLNESDIIMIGRTAMMLSHSDQQASGGSSSDGRANRGSGRAAAAGPFSAQQSPRGADNFDDPEADFDEGADGEPPVRSPLRSWRDEAEERAQAYQNQGGPGYGQPTPGQYQQPQPQYYQPQQMQQPPMQPGYGDYQPMPGQPMPGQPMPSQAQPVMYQRSGQQGYGGMQQGLFQRAMQPAYDGYQQVPQPQGMAGPPPMQPGYNNYQPNPQGMPGRPMPPGYGGYQQGPQSPPPPPMQNSMIQTNDGYQPGPVQGAPRPAGPQHPQQGAPRSPQGAPRPAGPPRPPQGAPRPAGPPRPPQGAPRPAGPQHQQQGAPRPAGPPRPPQGAPRPAGPPGPPQGAPRPAGPPRPPQGAPRPAGPPGPPQGAPRPAGPPRPPQGAPRPAGPPRPPQGAPRPAGPPRAPQGAPRPAGPPRAPQGAPRPAGPPRPPQGAPRPDSGAPQGNV